MAGGHRQALPPTGEDRADRDVGLLRREEDDRRVDFAAAYPSEGIAQRHLGDLHGAAGMPGLEERDRIHDLVVGRPLEAEAQDSAATRRSPPGVVHGGVQRRVRGGQRREEAHAERGQAHATARTLDQFGADAALEGTEQLAHPALRDVQAFPGAPEVQFLGQDQERLDLPHVDALGHGVPFLEPPTGGAVTIDEPRLWKA